MGASLTHSAGWRALRAHAERLRARRTLDLFAGDPQRAAHFSADACGLHLDYSKQRVSADTMALLHQLWQAADVPGWWESVTADGNPALAGDEPTTEPVATLQDLPSDHPPVAAPLLQLFAELHGLLQGARRVPAGDLGAV